MSFNTFSQEVNEFFGQIDSGLSKASGLTGGKFAPRANSYGLFSLLVNNALIFSNNR